MDPDQIMTALVICDGWVNNGKFCDPRIDKVVQQAKLSTDQAERKRLYRQAADLEYENADQLWLYYEWREIGLSKKVKGFYLVPDMRYRAKTVWLDG
jgi:peptide/nickel transport system substrate-binding protein